MDGKINQQGTSYRRGLVLGLTMAEIMLLLIFCLLIAMTTFLRREQNRLVQAEQKLAERQMNAERNAAAFASLKQELAEKLSTAAGLDPAAVDAYWRDLVESKAALAKIAEEGTSLTELREKAAATDALRKAGIDNDKALRDAEIVGAIKRALPEPERTALTPKAAADLVAHAPKPQGDGGGNRFPPIISLTEEKGYTFRTGSAELGPTFKEALTTTTLENILATIKRYDVDVIEVVGHTDEQAYGPRLASSAVDPTDTIALSPPAVVPRSSNLDHGLVAVLNNTTEIGRLTPADNAGLGLARAVSVVAELRKSEKLAAYKLIPLSAGQLVDINENLALNGAAGGDVAQRRRIEIRLRKSSPHEAAASILTPAPAVRTQRRPSSPKPNQTTTRRPAPTQQRPLALTPPPSQPTRSPNLFNLFRN